MPITRLSVSEFRNLTTQALDVPLGLTAVVGANGSGKTSLLESIAVLGNLGSFRPGPAMAWIRRGAEQFALAATVDRAGAAVEMRHEIQLKGQVVRSLFRGARRLGAAEYLDLLPVATLSGYDRALIWGAPEDRRRFLDRLCFQLKPEALPVLQRYRRALRQRNALLARGGRGSEFDAFEHDLAQLGARVIGARLAAVAGLERFLWEELDVLGWSLARPVLRYNSPDGVAVAEPATLAARLRAALAASRRLERGRGHTAVGPHRHDLQLTVHGAPAREILSAGQGKLLATGLKLAAMALVGAERGRTPVVVFDDVDAELDAEVLRRVVGRLERVGQALLSSAHEEMMLPRVTEGAVWRMDGGTVEVVAPGGKV
ncbi:MAG TPA: DNA replication and repair protein RecF [Thermoanaerobaculaceae bacterium]|nr:DNA replication and repair protein RecF [Thermoanaerobaculaceae bacterium]